MASPLYSRLGGKGAIEGYVWMWNPSTLPSHCLGDETENTLLQNTSPRSGQSTVAVSNHDADHE